MVFQTSIHIAIVCVEQSTFGQPILNKRLNISLLRSRHNSCYHRVGGPVLGSCDNDFWNTTFRSNVFVFLLATYESFVNFNWTLS